MVRKLGGTAKEEECSGWKDECRRVAVGKMGESMDEMEWRNEGIVSGERWEVGPSIVGGVGGGGYGKE